MGTTPKFAIETTPTGNYTLLAWNGSGWVATQTSSIGTTTIYNDLTVSGNITSNNLTASGNITSNNLTVSGNITANGTISGVSPQQMTALAGLATLITSGTCIIAPNGVLTDIVSITAQGIYDIDIFNVYNGFLSSFKFTYFNGVGRLYTIFSEAMVSISYNSLTHFLTGITYIPIPVYINWNYLKKNNNLLM
jgi:hypothetical protein